MCCNFTGFETIFVGEVNGTEVVGLNNWYRFYRLEMKDMVNYHGWFDRAKVSQRLRSFACVVEIASVRKRIAHIAHIAQIPRIAKQNTGAKSATRMYKINIVRTSLELQRKKFLCVVETNVRWGVTIPLRGIQLMIIYAQRS